MSELFRVVLSLSLSGSVLLLAVFLCNTLLRNRLSKRFQYYIWLVVVVRLLLPFTPEQGILPALWEQDAPAQSQPAEPQDTQAPSTALTEPVTEPQSPAHDAPQTTRQTPGAGREAWDFIRRYGWVLWLAVALGLLIRKVTLYQSFVKYLRAGERPVEDLDTLNRFAELCETLGAKAPGGAVHQPPDCLPVDAGLSEALGGAARTAGRRGRFPVYLPARADPLQTRGYLLQMAVAAHPLYPLVQSPRPSDGEGSGADL